MVLTLSLSLCLSSFLYPSVFFFISMTKSPYCSFISLDIFKMILCSGDHNNNKPLNNEKKTPNNTTMLLQKPFSTVLSFPFSLLFFLFSSPSFILHCHNERHSISIYLNSSETIIIISKAIKCH